jgi:hypothetical protein
MVKIGEESIYQTDLAAKEPLEPGLAPLRQTRLRLRERLDEYSRVLFRLRPPLLHVASLPVQPERTLGGQAQLTGFTLVHLTRGGMLLLI